MQSFQGGIVIIVASWILITDCYISISGTNGITTAAAVTITTTIITVEVPTAIEVVTTTIAAATTTSEANQIQ